MTGPPAASPGPGGGADAAVVVLAGGGARRFGSDKLAAPLGPGEPTVLDHLLATLPPAAAVVCVGPPRPVARPVTWVREDPPGSGPLAGIAAGLGAVRAGRVALVAGDMPLAGPAVGALLGLLGTHRAVAADDRGRPHPLLLAGRTADLRAALPPEPAGLPARRLAERLSPVVVPLPAGCSADVDTPEDLARLALRSDHEGDHHP